MTKNRIKSVIFGGLILTLSLPLVGRAGGSIVINASAPASELVYREDTGSAKALKVTWTDIQVMDATRRFLTQRFGAAQGDQPFFIDRKNRSVKYFDPTAGDYDKVGFSELLGGP